MSIPLSGAVLFNSLTGGSSEAVTDQEAIQAAIITCLDILLPA